MAELPPAPKHNVRDCNDLGMLLENLRHMGGGEGVLIKDGRIAIAPYDNSRARAKFSEKLAYTGIYRIVINQLEGRPPSYIIKGNNFTFTFELSETNNKGTWFMTGDPYEKGEKQRAYVAAGLGPNPMWAEHTQVRLYINKPDEG